MAKKGLGLPQTRGSFQIKGIVSGTARDSFYTEKDTKNGNKWRNVNFGLTFDKDSTTYASLNGMERDTVYFSKRGEDKKVETKAVPWRDRFTFAEDDFKLIGVNLGLTKVTTKEGKEVNDKKRLTEFDSCEYIHDNLKDDMTVFVRGNIEYSTYNEKHRVSFVPNQISLAKPIDFDEDEIVADFTQSIVFMGIKMDEEKKQAVVNAKIVNYNSIEDAEFIIKDSTLAKIFKKNLKPYNSIKVWGNIGVHEDVQEVSESDGWGTENKMEKVSGNSIRELIITGADPHSIDRDVYSEEAIDNAIAIMNESKNADKDYGDEKSDSTWGSVSSVGSEDDDELGW